MGKIVERKKKGRPSLLDLQKRNLKEQQQQTPNPNYKTTSSITSRRSTCRKPSPDGILPSANANEASGDEGKVLSGKRREKNLKLVLKLPSRRSSSLNSDFSHDSESNAEDDINHKKQKINAIGVESEQEEKHHVSTSTAVKGTQLEVGPSTPLPDKKLLLFILDRLQKKDTYSVFSEPVDPNELPDYHEVIKHPMDFGTVRKKLVSGAYANLDQFEKDVILICSNAMQYNAPDTIYFRQARSIHELAKRNFENLRQDSDNNETERKVVRRGRPPTKNLIKQVFRPSLDRPGSELSSDAILAKKAESNTWSNYDLKKGLLIDKSGSADFSGRSFLDSRNSGPSPGCLVEHKFERNDDVGSILKQIWIKNGKKQVALDENRRNTYKQSHLSANGREPSVMMTFNGERKQLMAVGLHSEYGYARSLARFAGNLGPVAWKVALKKIEKSLPDGINFGPGWVGENELVPPRAVVLFSSPAPDQMSPSSQPFSLPGNSCKPSTLEMRVDKSFQDPERDNLSERHMPSTHSDSDCHQSKTFLSSLPTSSSPIVANISPETISERAEADRGLNSHSRSNVLCGFNGVIRPGTPFQILQNPVIRQGINGFNGAYGFKFPAQMGQPIGSIRPGGINSQSSWINDTINKANSRGMHQVTENGLNSKESMLLENTARSNSDTSLPNSGCGKVGSPKLGHQPQTSWQEVCQQQKLDSVPPDLNIRFQTPGSPNSSRVDSVQPDLALQL